MILKKAPQGAFLMGDSIEFENSAAFKPSCNTRQRILESNRLCKKLQRRAEIIEFIRSALDHRIKLIAYQGQTQRVHVHTQLMALACDGF